MSWMSKLLPGYFVIIYGLLLGLMVMLPAYMRYDVGKLMGERMRRLDYLLSCDWSQAMYDLTLNPDHMVGYYVYQMLYGKLVGLADPIEIVQEMWLLMYIVPFMVVPLFVRHYFQSNALILLSPVLLSFCWWKVVIAHHDDSTWFIAWTVYAILPLIFIVISYGEKWLKTMQMAKFVPAFIGISLMIGIANIGRLHAGLSLVIVIISVMLVGIKRYYGISLKAVLIFICSLGILNSSYFMFTNSIPDFLIRQQGYQSGINYFGPWHTLYIGLGWKNYAFNHNAVPGDIWQYDKNPEYIVYLDECAISLVSSQSQDIGILSDEYFQILKKEYIRIGKEHTAWFVVNYIEKWLACLYVSLRYQLVSIAILLVVMRRLHARKKLILLPEFIYGSLIFVVLFDTIFGMIAVPANGYLQGSMAAASMLTFCMMLDVLRSISKYFIGQEIV